VGQLPDGELLQDVESRIYPARYETRAQARLDIVGWMEAYYNRQRLHISIDFLAPVEYEAALIAA
jgi:putative transposase